MSDTRFDIVFMWVDDRWPGYAETLSHYANTRHDRNPNRTRDNLELLRFALRSIERFAPWRGTIHLVTCRPQCPSWLNRDHPNIRVVHHDAFMPAEMLPTFNSFAIQSCLYLLPGLSRRFVSFDDDMLLMRETGVDDFVSPAGRIRYRFDGVLPHRNETPARLSPWNAALANNARLLDTLGHTGPHKGFAHGPKLYDVEDCRDIVARWPDAFATTRASRFRGHDNIAMEALLPQYLVEQGRAEAVGQAETKRENAYFGLENMALWNRFRLGHIARKRPIFLTLNDNFGPNPNPSAEAAARQFLLRHFPTPSVYERG